MASTDLGAAKTKLQSDIRRMEAELSDLKSKLEVLMNAEELAESITGGATQRQGDRFANMGATEAIRLLIPKGSKRHWFLADIVSALEQGGFETSSKDLRNLINSTLFNMVKSGELIAVDTDDGRAYSRPGGSE